MIRWSFVVLASLGVTQLALAQPPPQLQPQPPPPPGAVPVTPGGEAPAPQSKLGADLAFVLPVGDYGEGTDAAFGLFGRLELGLSSQMALTGRVGFLYHFIEAAEDLDVSLTMFPIYGGIRYNVEPTSDGLFFLGEAGLNIIRVSFSAFGIEDSNTEVKPSLDAGAGFQSGALHVKGTVFVTVDTGEDAEGGSTSLVGVMATVGYDFAAL